jgi:hypothetical protein
MSEAPATPPTSAPTAARASSQVPAVVTRSCKLWLALGAAAIALAAFAGGCAYRATTDKQLIEVACSPIKGGRECFVSVTQGRMNDARICWELHQVCENGIKVKAEKCVRETLVAGSRSRTLLADSEFVNLERCDKVSASQIESLTGVENFTQLELQRK